jgi:tetratricopeptide (TPR) repeat protein
VGEVVNFSLIFPPVLTSSKLLNLIEDCDKACFSFKGIILDKKLNDDINTYTTGVAHYAANRTNEAIECFMKVVEIIPEFPTHVYGYSYFNLIRIYSDKGDKLTSKYWLDQLEKSSLPDKQYFIDALKKERVIGK